ncbi:hypothetical protein [Nocardiopsis alkaliphila]|uniref:hypothetical protein n=1 Tax=Nocardiopsis alkaliphila TaxID=225762 RepID=UPI000348F606|nr:hypothetical protein [Nocardiopsis alkaliphila]
MYADLTAQAADIYRAEAERTARHERLIAEAQGGEQDRFRRVWARLRVQRTPRTLAA